MSGRFSDDRPRDRFREALSKRDGVEPASLAGHGCCARRTITVERSGKGHGSGKVTTTVAETFFSVPLCFFSKSRPLDVDTENTKLTYEPVGGFAAVTEALQHGIANEIDQHF